VLILGRSTAWTGASPDVIGPSLGECGPVTRVMRAPSSYVLATQVGTTPRALSLPKAGRRSNDQAQDTEPNP
jgi:hypothetical protein